MYTNFTGLNLTLQASLVNISSIQNNVQLVIGNVTGLNTTVQAVIVNVTALRTNDQLIIGNVSGLNSTVQSNYNAALNSTGFSASNLTSGTLQDARLNTTAVSPNSYGNSTSIGTFTVDSKGRLTAASNTAININFGQVNFSGMPPCSGEYQSTGRFQNATGFFENCTPAGSGIYYSVGIASVNNTNGSVNVTPSVSGLIAGSGVSLSTSANNTWTITSTGGSGGGNVSGFPSAESGLLAMFNNTTGLTSSVLGGNTTNLYTSANLSIGNNSGGAVTLFLAGTRAAVRYTGTGYGFGTELYSADSTKDVVLSPGGNKVLVTNSTGNVCVNCTIANSTLQVAGNVNISGLLDLNGNATRGDTANYVPSMDGLVVNLNFNNASWANGSLILDTGPYSQDAVLGLQQYQPNGSFDNSGFVNLSGNAAGGMNISDSAVLDQGFQNVSGGKLTANWWMQFNKTLQSSTFPDLMLKTQGTNLIQYEIYYGNASAVFSFKISNGGATSDQSAIVLPASLDTTQWHMYTVVADTCGDQKTYGYIDGVLVTTGTIAINNCTAGLQNVTSTLRLFNTFYGNFDSYSLYYAKLNSAQVQALYEQRDVQRIPELSRTGGQMYGTYNLTGRLIINGTVLTPNGANFSQFNVSNGTSNTTFTNNSNLVITGNTSIQVNQTGGAFTVGLAPGIAGSGLQITGGVLSATASGGNVSGQYLIGGNTSGGNLTYADTTTDIKSGPIFVNQSTAFVMGIGTTSPTEFADWLGSSTIRLYLHSQSASGAVAVKLSTGATGFTSVDYGHVITLWGSGMQPSHNDYEIWRANTSNLPALSINETNAATAINGSNANYTLDVEGGIHSTGDIIQGTGLNKVLDGSGFSALNITSDTINPARLPILGSLVSQFNVTNGSVNTTITNNTNVAFNPNSSIQVNLTGSTFTIGLSPAIAGSGLSIAGGVLTATAGAPSTPISQFNISNGSTNTTVTNNTNILFTGNETLLVNLTGSGYTVSPAATLAGTGLTISSGVLGVTSNSFISQLRLDNGGAPNTITNNTDISFLGKEPFQINLSTSTLTFGLLSTIAGNGLNINGGDLAVNDTFYGTRNITNGGLNLTNGSLFVSENTTLKGNLNVTKNLSVDDGTFFVNSYTNNVSVGGSFVTNSQANLTGTVYLNSTKCDSLHVLATDISTGQLLCRPGIEIRKYTTQSEYAFLNGGAGTIISTNANWGNNTVIGMIFYIPAGSFLNFTNISTIVTTAGSASAINFGIYNCTGGAANASMACATTNLLINSTNLASNTATMLNFTNMSGYTLPGPNYYIAAIADAENTTGPTLRATTAPAGFSQDNNTIFKCTGTVDKYPLQASNVCTSRSSANGQQAPFMYLWQ
jgi:hypothetical protein